MDIASVSDGSLAAQLAAQGAAPAPMAPAQFGVFVQKERHKYEALVKASGAKAD